MARHMCLSMNRTEDTRILSYMNESLYTSIKKTKALKARIYGLADVSINE